jgi:hypothetical protein
MAVSHLPLAPKELNALSVIRVGDGRGFVVETRMGDRFVITAAHCLPHLPPCLAAAIDERSFPNLIGALGAEPIGWAECLFVDPVNDIAVLGSPDGQELSDEAGAYNALLSDAVPLSVGALTFHTPTITFPSGSRRPEAESDAWLLSLDGNWFSCHVRSDGRSIWIKDVAEPIRGGMSGSPIISPEGAALGIVSVSIGTPEDHHDSGPNPELGAHLPIWLAREFGLLPAL